jgi:DNA-binding CsgD family transcriptional regulator
MKDLTEKERAVMELVVLGKTRVEIALILALPPITIKGRMESIRKKLDASNKTLAVAKYLAPERFKR